MEPANTSVSRRAGILGLLTSALSNQSGAAIGSLAFPVIGPLGVVAVRQFVTAAILLPVIRPRIWTFSWAQWWPVLLLSLVLVTINSSLYLAIDRIGLGLAVTLEFLGPLLLALAGTRSWSTFLTALTAGAGILAVTQPQPTTDFLGVGLALIAAACWAAYILLNRTVGRQLPGAQGTATATGLAAIISLPIGLVILANSPPTSYALIHALAAGVLASTIPYVLDLAVLRKVPPHLYGVLVSVNPVFAALIGVIALNENLNTLAWAGIVLIVAANICAVLVAPTPPDQLQITKHREKERGLP